MGWWPLRIYYFNCGHVADHFVHRTKRSKASQCPYCTIGTVQAVKTFCFECGCEIGFDSARSNRRFCNECRLAHRPGGRRKRDEHVRYDDCRFYETCLTDAARANNEFDCRGCDRYEKGQGLNVMEYVLCRPTIENVASFFSSPDPRECRRR